MVDAVADLSTLERAEAVAAAVAANGKLSKPEEKALLEALSVRDPEAPALDEPDPELRDQESVPLPARPVSFDADPSERLKSGPYLDAVEEYMGTEVLPYVADAWVDHTRTKLGYEVLVGRYFYKYVPPRPLREIDAEVQVIEAEVQDLLKEIAE
jgi:type I restriction enzyme M protein